jgi:hypothetical protein
LSFIDWRTSGACPSQFASSPVTKSRSRERYDLVGLPGNFSSVRFGSSLTAPVGSTTWLRPGPSPTASDVGFGCGLARSARGYGDAAEVVVATHPASTTSPPGHSPFPLHAECGSPASSWVARLRPGPTPVMAGSRSEPVTRPDPRRPA